MGYAYSAKVAATTPDTHPPDWPDWWTYPPPRDDDNDDGDGPWPPGWPLFVSGYTLQVTLEDPIPILQETVASLEARVLESGLDTSDLELHLIRISCALGNGDIVQFALDDGPKADYAFALVENYSGSQYGLSETLYLDLLPEDADINDQLTVTVEIISVTPNVQGADTSTIEPQDFEAESNGVATVSGTLLTGVLVSLGGSSAGAGGQTSSLTSTPKAGQTISAVTAGKTWQYSNSTGLWSAIGSAQCKAGAEHPFADARFFIFRGWVWFDVPQGYNNRTASLSVTTTAVGSDMIGKDIEVYQTLDTSLLENPVSATLVGTIAHSAEGSETLNLSNAGSVTSSSGIVRYYYFLRMEDESEYGQEDSRTTLSTLAQLTII